MSLALYVTPPASGGGGASPPGNIAFIYRQGAASSANVYGTWAALMTDLAKVAGPKIIQVDNSITAPCTVPAGTYDLNAVTFVSENEDTLSFLDGAHLTAATLYARGGITLSADGTTPVWTVATDFSLFAVNELSTVQGTTAPFVSVPNAINFVMLVDGESFLGDGAHGAVTSAVDAICFVDAYSNSSVQANALAGLGQITLNQDNSVASTAQTVTTLVRNLISNANVEAYTPGTAANWLTAPTTTQGALDGLAGVLSPNRTGARNSQAGTFPLFAQFGRTSGVGQTVTQTIAIPQGATMQIAVTVIGRVVTAGGIAVVGDSFGYFDVLLVKNIAGTLTVVGGLPAAIFSKSDTSQAGDTVTTGTAANAITLIATQAGATNTGTVDWQMSAQCSLC